MFFLIIKLAQKANYVKLRAVETCCEGTAANALDFKQPARAGKTFQTTSVARLIRDNSYQLLKKTEKTLRESHVCRLP